MSDRDKRKAFNRELKRQLELTAKRRALTIKEIERISGVALARIRETLQKSPSDYQRWYLPSLEREIQGALTQLGVDAGNVAKAAVSEGWAQGIAIVDQPLRAAGINIVLPAIDTRQLLAIEHFTVRKMTSIGAAAMDSISTQLGLVMMGAQPVGDAITSITHTLEETSRTRAISIVRTEIGRATGISRQERMTQTVARVPGMKKQWKKSGKLHPRETHALAHNQIRDVDKPFQIGAVQMMHPHDPTAPLKETIQCGCLSVPYMESWDLK